MKILVGTLYSGENEFEECVNAIKQQTHPDFDHIIIQGLPQHQAHRELYETFLAQKDTYDLLIKVDADTVIKSSNLFEDIELKITENPWLEVMNIGVDDFFTARMIPAGIQVYRNTVTWNFDKETAFPDIPDNPADKYYYDKSELAPAAVHCKNPSKYQAFHYGVHRGIKSLQKIHSTSHWNLLKSVWHNFLKTRDVRIGLAVLGAELVYAGKFNKLDADYTNPKMKYLLEKYDAMNSAQIEREIISLRRRHWGFLPDDLRRRWLRYLRGLFFTDDDDARK